MVRAHAQSILIVEEDRQLNEAYQKLLRGAGYTVQAAFSSQDALEQLAVHEPSLIILDTRLPGATGLELLHEYQQMAAKTPAKTIIVSGDEDEAAVSRAYQLGVEHYLVKKWLTPARLLQLVSNTLQNR